MWGGNLFELYRVGLAESSLCNNIKVDKDSQHMPIRPAKLGGD